MPDDYYNFRLYETDYDALPLAAREQIEKWAKVTRKWGGATFRIALRDWRTHVAPHLAEPLPTS